MQVYIPSVQTVVHNGVLYQGAYARNIDFKDVNRDKNDVVYTHFLVKLINDKHYFKEGVYEFKSAIKLVNDVYNHCKIEGIDEAEESFMMEKMRILFEYEPFLFVQDLSEFDPNDVSAYSLLLCLDTSLNEPKIFNIFNWVFANETRMRALLKVNLGA